MTATSPTQDWLPQGGRGWPSDVGRPALVALQGGVDTGAPTVELAVVAAPGVAERRRQRWIRAAVAAWLMIAVALTVLAVVTAGSPGAPTAPAPAPVSVSGPTAGAVGTAGLAPSIQPAP